MPQGTRSHPPPPRENAHLAFPGTHSSTLGGWLRRCTLTKPPTQAEAATGGKNPTPARDKDAEILLPTVWSPLAHPLIRVMGALPPCPRLLGEDPSGPPRLAPQPPEAVHPRVEGGLRVGSGDAAQERGGVHGNQ